MNKKTKFIVALAGGANTIIYILTPLALMSLFVTDTETWRSILLFVAGGLASLYRAFKTSKITEFIKKDE